MVALVADHGYEVVSIERLVALAGISKRDFYKIFASKEECFLATFESINERSTAVVASAYESGSGVRGKLLAALRAYADLVADQPDEASLAIVDLFSLGIAALAPREAAEARFAGFLRQSLEVDPKGGEISEIAIRGIIGGARRVLYGRLREGHPEDFGSHAEELVDWALDYRSNGSVHLLDESFFATLSPRGPSAETRAGKPVWEESPSSPRARAMLSGRERITRAVAQLAAARGYASLSMPAIANAAAVSNRTFYQEFNNKHEAFLAAFDALVERALERSAPETAQGENWAESVGALLWTILSVVADNPLLARLAFVELAAAGPSGRDRKNQVLDGFLPAISADILPEGFERPPDVIMQAIGGGIWTVIEQEVGQGRTKELPSLAPELADFALRGLCRGRTTGFEPATAWTTIHAGGRIEPI